MNYNSIRQGIVLRVPSPDQHIVSLFDSQQGRLKALTNFSPSIVHGELISYRLEPWRQTYRLYDVHIMQLPASWVYTDILFLHHVLEMAFFFLPEHSCALHVFRLCGMLYDDHHAHHIDHALLKKLFLGKFFALLGIYPEQAFQQDIQLFNFFSKADNMVPHEIHNIDELQKKLQNWILGCIQTHPHANTFTTVNFLYTQS